MKVFISFLACLSLAVSIADAQAEITINSNWVTVTASYNPYFDEKNFQGTTIPASATVSAVAGSNSNDDTINWSFSGGQTILSYDMNHRRTGNQYSFVRTENTRLEFTADSDEPYQITGYYNIAHVGRNGIASLQVRLIDQTDGVDRFWNWQTSVSTKNEQFVVGGKGGDSTNVLQGSLTGNLIAGHVYNFYFKCVTSAYPATDSGASALGNITLTIGTVPEPSTLMLLGIGAISLLGYRRRDS